MKYLKKILGGKGGKKAQAELEATDNEQIVENETIGG